MKRIQTPVLLLTGYLGSGKTTLVNRILNNRRGIKFAVIVNDIGEVNIDADLIERGGIVDQQDDSLVALQNGCICCTLQMDLVEQLRGIMAQKRFDYIVIEASGICEPAPIAQTICSMPHMDAAVTAHGTPVVDCIATVVDALRLKDEFACGDSLRNKRLAEEDIENLVIQQIEFCNVILLNKASAVEPAEKERIHQILRAIQPKAEIIECDYCDIDLDKIVGTGMFDFDTVATSATWIAEIEGHHEHSESSEHSEHHHHHDHPEGCTCGHCHHHGDHDHSHGEEYGIGTYVYHARRPMDIALFDDFVARLWPKNIIRAKGICYFQSEQHICYVFEQAGKQVSLRNAGQWYATMPDEELKAFLEQNPAVRADWDETYGDRMQKLVFIGQHLDKKLLRDRLDACLV